MGVLDGSGTGFGVEIVGKQVAQGLDPTTGTVARFEHRHLMSRLFQLPGRCETRETGTDNDDLLGGASALELGRRRSTELGRRDERSGRHRS